jgi:hypothetical protein
VSEFRSFASLLAEPPHADVVPPLAPQTPPLPEARVEPPTPPPIAPREVDAPPATSGAGPQLAAVLASFASEIVRLRARAAELVESEAESMLQMLASRVLVRELELAPADLLALARQVRAEWNGSHTLRFRVAEADMPRLAGLGEALESDPALQPGDLQVELPEGILDLRLGTRLAAVLETHRIAV